MKKQISRLFLAVFMITALLFCMNMTAFAAEATFTGNETDFSASVSTDNATVKVVVSEAQNTDIIAGDKLVVTDTGTSNSAGILSSNETEFVEVIAGGTMEVQDENGHEKVVRDSADINTNDIPLDYDTDDDGCVTTYVTQKFNQSQLAGVMGANQTKDLIFKSQLANPGAGEDKDPEVTVINKNQIQAVGGGYTVTVSFDGIRDWIFGLVNHTVSVDYNLQKITSNEEMSKKVNQDINLLKQNLEDGSAMFKIPTGGAKIWLAGSKADYADATKREQMEANFDAAQQNGTLPGIGVNGSPLTFDAINRASNRGPGDGFLGAVKQKGQGFDGCPGAVIGCENGAWKHGCSGGGVSYGENGLYYAYTYDHAELTEADLHFELKDKEANRYAPAGNKTFTKDDVELYFYGEDGKKVTLGFFDFVDNYMSGASDDGTITVCFGGIYKTINLGEQPKPFFITPSTVSYLIKTGYYPAFLSNENSAASFTIDFAQDAAHPENNTIYITAEPNADGKFEPTTMQFNSTLIRHLSQALVNTVSLTVGDNEVVISYASVAELVKKYDGVSFILTVDGDKVTATIMNKQGIVTDVTSELEMTVNKK